MAFCFFVVMNSSKRVLVAPLNWGLGHATRCVPIIHELIQHGLQPYLAKKMQKQGLVPYSKQEEFKLSDLSRTMDFDGLTQFDSIVDFSSLFELFSETGGLAAFSKVKENSEPTSTSLST